MVNSLFGIHKRETGSNAVHIVPRFHFAPAEALAKSLVTVSWFP